MSSTASSPTEDVLSQPHQQYVDHTYTDYANVDEDDLRLLKESGDDKGAPSKAKLLNITSSSYGPLKSKCSTVMPFPGKLLEVLDRGDLTSIIDWMPHGRAFIVKQPKIFTTQVLPRFFKQTKFLSFTRQLNLWGFKRITRGIDAGAYYHELFLPGHPNLSLRMRRQKIKGTGIRPIPNPEKEPNFYYQFPHTPKVQRSGAPIPLPLLPSERMASLMSGVDPMTHSMSAARAPLVPQQVLSQSSYMPQVIPSMGASLGRNIYSASLSGLGIQGEASALSLKNSLGAMSAAATAEARLLGLTRPGLGLSVPRNVSKPSSNFSRLDHELLSLKPSLGLPSMGAAAAPLSFNPIKETEDEVFNANRRLMERLLNQAPSSSAMSSDSTTQHTPLHELNRRQSFKECLLRRASNEASLERLSAAPPSATPVPTLPTVHRESFNLRNPPVTSNSSLFGTQDYNSYIRGSSVQPLSSLASTRSTGSQDVNFQTVTDALREAQQLEKLARSQRATAQALADALHQRVGQDVQGLLSLGQQFKGQR